MTPFQNIVIQYTLFSINYSVHPFLILRYSVRIIQAFVIQYNTLKTIFPKSARVGHGSERGRAVSTGIRTATDLLPFRNFVILLCMRYTYILPFSSILSPCHTPVCWTGTVKKVSFWDSSIIFRVNMSAAQPPCTWPLKSMSEPACGLKPNVYDAQTVRDSVGRYSR